jgi:hypothetical protein
MDAPDALPGFIEALKNLAWYAVFGYGAWLLIALWTRWKPEVFDSIPAKLQWLPAYLISGLTAFAVAFSAGLEWQHALGAGVLAALTGGQIAVGTHRTLKELKAGSHRRKMKTPPDGTRPRSAVLLVLMALMLPVGVTSCGAIPASVSASLPAIFSAIGTAEAAVNTFQAWANRFQGAPGVTPEFLASVSQSADEARKSFAEARELARKGAEFEEQAKRATNQGLAAFDAMRQAFKSIGLFRSGRLIHPPDGRALGPDELEVALPPRSL